MKKINQNSQLQFQKVKIARLTNDDLEKIRGGETQDTSDSVSFTVIKSSLKCILSIRTTISG